MKNGKKITQLLLLLTFTFTLCGCTRIEQTLTMGENGITTYNKVAYNKEKTDEYRNSQGDNSAPPENVHIEKIDGQDYYVEEESSSMSYEEAMKSDPSHIVSSDTYFYKSNDVYDSSSSQNTAETEALSAEMFEKITVKVTFQKPIQATNGTLSADGYSATWEYDSKAIANATSVLRYAYTGTEHVAADTAAVNQKLKIANDKKKPVIKGIKNKKIYNKKSITFYIKDNTGIKSIKLNGKKIKLNKKKSGKYKNYYKVTSKKTGKNTVIATDLNGNKNTIKFTLKK